MRSPDGLTREFSLLPGNTRVSFLTRIRDRVGHFVDFAYDRDHLLETVTTSEGRWIRLEHRNGLLRRIAVPIAERDEGWYNQVSFEYSAEGDLVKATDSLGNARVYRYENHLLIQETDRDGVTFWFEYDGRDGHANCVRTWGSDGKGQDRLFFREISYDRKNMVTLVEDSLGNVTAYKMNVLNGVEEIIDPEGARTKFEYNEFLWKIAQTDALGSTTRFEYDARGNETKRVFPNGAQVMVEFDDFDQPVRMRDPLGVDWSWRYDGWGRLLQRWNSAGEVTTFAYEGRILRSVTQADEVRYTFDYDGGENVSRITFPDGTVQERWYDRQDRLIKVRDALGRAQRFTYDWESRLVRVEETGGLWRGTTYSPEGDIIGYSDNLRRIQFGYSGYHRLAWREEGGDKIQYRYSTEDELLEVVNEVGEVYAFKRDACGRIVEERSFEGRTHTFERDAAGRMIKRLRPSKQAELIVYDVMGNVISVTYPDGSVDRFSYDAVGNLLSAANPTGTVKWERDARGRVLNESFGDDWIASRYDRLGGRIEIESSRGLHQQIGRTPLGDVLSVGLFERDASGAARAVWGIRYQRDAIGRETARSMPGDVVALRGYNDRGLPSIRELLRGKERIARTDYIWDGDDRLRRREDHAIGVTDYAHDARGRLNAARFPDGTIQVRAPGPSGNLYKRRDRNDRVYGAAGILREADGMAFLYSSDGALIRKRAADGKEWKFTWNGSEMLAAVERPDGGSVEFLYDALGRRVKKVVHGADGSEATTEWRWDRNVPVHEWRTGAEHPDGTAIMWLFEPESFSPVGKVEQSSGQRAKRYSIVADYLGTPEEMVDEAGEIVWKARLDAFGASNVTTGRKDTCPWRWPGQYEDDETGLHYNRFRYFDSTRGDYISQDPIRLAGGTELYGYTSDPLVWVDPFGLNEQGGDCGKKTGEIDPSNTPVYRGGSSMQARPIDVKIGPNGMVKPTRGISLNGNPAGLERFGGAFRVKSVPEGLAIVPQGRAGHYEIVPRSEMSMEQYQFLLNLVKFF
ncbi:RHS repeat-associated core domain-containing protein [Pendulispora albinea]|uniref:RHS domain-containing protein n=1 Tax=Pendulispora albinea TaxID=2741071 RepID=A0ABZ2LTJ1_9BACT